MKSLLSILFFAAVFSASYGIEVDVLYEDRSCWPVDQFPELRSWEGKDPLLDSPYKLREDAVQKCAKVASKHGFRFFAIKDEKLCLTGPLVEFNFTARWPCREENIHLYQVNTIVEAKFVPLGCRRIEHRREDWFPLPLLFEEWNPEYTWLSREEALEKCARFAAIAGFHIFGFQEGHLCSGWRRTLDEIRVYPRDINCSTPGDRPMTGVVGHTPELFHLTEITNISLWNMGCWIRDPLVHAFPLLESRSEILGDWDFKSRLEAVRKCALYNAARGNEFFALTDQGACAGSPLRRPPYEEAGRSQLCLIKGRGAENANQVYKIVREIINITFEPLEPFKPLHLTPLGCWRVELSSPIPTLEGADELLLDEPELRKDPIERCAWAARRRGWDVIAIREGRCYSAVNARKLFRIYGHSEECRPGWGSRESMSVFDINIVRDPWFTNEGCFERCEPIDLLERRHPLLEDDVSERWDPVRKCAQVASLWEYDSFALLNGGLCYGLWWNTTRKCIQSASCRDDGRGGRFAHQIYRIKEWNNFTLQNLGCWKDDAFRNIPIAEGASRELSGRFVEREDAIGACARYARSRGFKVFALQAGGMCMTSERAEDHYWRYGWSDKCLEDGKGGVWSNQVWKIHEDWWESPVDWWKIPKEWRPFGNWKCTWEWWKTPTTPWQ